MRKCLIIILMVLVVIPLTIAIEDCKGVMLPSDIPCAVIGSWQFPNACNTYNINVYDQNTTLLVTKTMGDYGSTGRCNVTFNYSSTGSYLLNWSSGDSAKIIVEGDDKMASLSVTLFIGAITALLIFAGLKWDFSKNPVANIMLKRSLILLGMFLLSLDTAIVVTMADNAGLGVNRELFRYLWLVNWAIYLFMVWIFWTTVINVIKMWNKLSKQKRMGDIGSEEEYT